MKKTKNPDTMSRAQLEAELRKLSYTAHPAETDDDLRLLIWKHIGPSDGDWKPEDLAEKWRDRPIDTRPGKYALITQLCNSMRDSFLAKLDKIPDNWDGIELRAWMAERWAHEGYNHALKKDRKRLRKYRSDCYAGNL